MDSPLQEKKVAVHLNQDLQDFQDLRNLSVTETDSTTSTVSLSDSSLEELRDEAFKTRDSLERIFYRTVQNESKTSVKFNLHTFFSLFLFKVKSDFSSSIDADATSFITRCVTHVRGLKCEIVVDSHFDTVTVMGVGHRLWRECYFSKVSQPLFRRFVQELDSQINDQSGDSEYISGSGCTNDESESDE